MANEPKPQPGTTGAGQRGGEAARQEREPDSAGSGARENAASDAPKRGPTETKPPGRRR